MQAPRTDAGLRSWGGRESREGREGEKRGHGGQPDRTRVTVEGERKDGQSCPLLDWNLFALVTVNPWGG